MNSIIKIFALPEVNIVGKEGDEITTVVGNIINSVIAVLGIVAVIVIIYGGISYMTSLGDSSKVKKGRDAILYGVIGLIICVLAFAITNFVIGTINQAS